jgi:uridine monophosphate synthetase
MHKLSTTLTFQKRAQHCKHPLGKRLFSLMEQKKTNLSVAVDVTSAQELLDFANLLGPSLCILKTHIDMLDDFTPDTIRLLKKTSEEHNFLLFEDRKFADIGHTVMHQYQGGIYKISSWAHITNAHSLPGSGIVEGLKSSGMKNGNGLLLLAELSSKDNFIDENYTQKTVELAFAYPEFVMGFICQKRLTNHPSYIHMTPGVEITSQGDSLGQRYNTPEEVITERGSDVIIVGRGIVKHPSPFEAASEYRERAWEAYHRHNVMF